MLVLLFRLRLSLLLHFPGIDHEGEVANISIIFILCFYYNCCTNVSAVTKSVEN